MKFVNNPPVAALAYSGKSAKESHFLFESDKSITSECVPFMNGNPVVTKILSIFRKKIIIINFYLGSNKVIEDKVVTKIMDLPILDANSKWD